MSGNESARQTMKLAVALQYEQGVGVPRVVAKGRGHIADRIVERAIEAGVPVEQDTAMATSLAQVDIDQNIPPELYKVVAKLIGFLMRKGSHR
jgi:flagellar biosynthesis protein